VALETLTTAGDLETLTATGGMHFTTQVYANQCAAAAGGAADGAAGGRRRRLLSRGLLDEHVAAEELAETLALAAVIGGNPTADQKAGPHTSSLFSSTASCLPLKPLAAIPTHLEDAQVKLKRGNSVTALSEG